MLNPNWLKEFCERQLPNSQRSRHARKPRARLFLEPLEERVVLAVFLVSTLADFGANSLRDAIDQAKSSAGPDEIEFAVTGTIPLLSALPSITDTVDIDGTTAPGFAGTRQVEVDYNGFAGMTFAFGSSGLELRSLGHINASTAGVTLNADRILLVGGDNLQLVGSYKNADASTAAVTVNGFLIEGTIADLAQSANYRTIDYPGAKFNYVHSTMGGLAVGNYDSTAEHGTHSLPLGPGHAFIYDIAQDAFLTDVVFPGALSNTAHNGQTSYTIVGGYSLAPINKLENPGQPFGQAYMVDYDSATSVFSNWASFDYPNGTNVTPFGGISSVDNGVYTLNADSAQSGSNNPAQGSWVSVARNDDGTFAEATWEVLSEE